MGWHELARSGPHGRPRRDWSFWAAVACAALMLVAVAVPLAQSMVLMHRYHGFVQDLSSSAAYGRNHGMEELVVGGEPREVSADQVSRLVQTLSHVGMGRPSDLVPDTPGATIGFGDGSSLSLWPVTIDEASRESDEGLLVRYVRADGTVFSYDTDRLSYQDALRILT